MMRNSEIKLTDLVGTAIDILSNQSQFSIFRCAIIGMD